MKTKTMPLSAHGLRELIACLALVGLPHWINLPYGPVAFFYLMLLYRFFVITAPRFLPNKSILLFLTILGGTIVWLQAGGVFGKTAGSGLLLAGTGLKLLELHTRRDSYIIAALAYLLAFTQILFSQDIPMAAYLLAEVILFSAVLIGMHCGFEGVSLRQRLRHSAALVGQAFPLAILLFLVAPRLPGPLWSFPEDNSALSGLSDRLEPGSINQLGLSDELAFRVNFDGPLPPQNQLYWRGPVFWWTDGKRWEMRALPALNNQEQNYTGTPLNYSIVLEPHGHKWLFSLDLPQTFPTDSQLTGDFQLLANEDIRSRRLYNVRSYPGYRYGNLNSSEKFLGLQLPKELSIELKNLVSLWRFGHDDLEVVKLALAYFHDNDFHYTLHPPLLPDRPIERFLLETRRGFCEHYATAFAVLMRLAHIPSRVVTGYQGGLWNATGKFLEVKQSDAHAWTEVWLNDQGWIRVDPTAAVAPQRIEKPVDAASFTAADTRLGRQPLWNVQAANSWLAPLRSFWANVDHGWHRWVLSYDSHTQESLLQWLGTSNWQTLAIACLALLVAMAIPFLWLFWRDTKQSAVDPALLCYRQFCAKLAAKGLPRRPGEGPTAYAARVVQNMPELSKDVEEITDAYVHLRYGSVCQEKLLFFLQKKVRQLN